MRRSDTASGRCFTFRSRHAAIAVALGLPGEGGTKNAYRPQLEVSPLHRVLKVARGWRLPKHAYFLRAESLYNVFTYLDEIAKLPGSPPPPELHMRSHGEAFMKVLQSIGGDGLYLLDEPEAALAVIDDLVKRGAQFIIATHSPILLAQNRGQTPILGNFLKLGSDPGVSLRAVRAARCRMLVRQPPPGGRGRADDRC